jgi:ribosomal-protein-alanine N-acetyltransferase
VATSGNRLIGYGVMSVGAGEAHILNLCIDEGFRCQGIGRRMLEYLLDKGAAAGMSEAFLEVRPSNTAAIRLYLSLGFDQVGMRRGYYQAVGGREDAAVLKLALRGRRSRTTP